MEPGKSEEELKVSAATAAKRSDGSKWLTVAIVLVFLICLIFAVYVIVAGFYWKPLPNG